MIELLLVVLIIAMAVGLAIPNITNTLAGAKIKKATRDIIALNRYARKSAVVHQRYMVVLYDTERGKVELLPMSSTGFQGAGPDPFSALSDARSVEEVTDEAEPEFQLIAAEMKGRRLADGVMLEDFKFPGLEDGQEEEGVFWAVYYPNGMCDAVQFTLADRRGKEVAFDIEPIAGEIKLKQNW